MAGPAGDRSPEQPGLPAGQRGQSELPAPCSTFGLAATVSEALFLEALSPVPWGREEPGVSGSGASWWGTPQTLGSCGWPHWVTEPEGGSQTGRPKPFAPL